MIHRTPGGRTAAEALYRRRTRREGKMGIKIGRKKKEKAGAAGNVEFALNVDRAVPWEGLWAWRPSGRRCALSPNAHLRSYRTERFCRRSFSVTES